MAGVTPVDQSRTNTRTMSPAPPTASAVPRFRFPSPPLAITATPAAAMPAPMTTRVLHPFVRHRPTGASMGSGSNRLGLSAPAVAAGQGGESQGGSPLPGACSHWSSARNTEGKMERRPSRSGRSKEKNGLLVLTSCTGSLVSATDSKPPRRRIPIAATLASRPIVDRSMEFTPSDQTIVQDAYRSALAPNREECAGRVHRYGQVASLCEKARPCPISRMERGGGTRSCLALLDGCGGSHCSSISA
jgi:hypothetical protein